MRKADRSTWTFVDAGVSQGKREDGTREQIREELTDDKMQ
jgi:hypothetical protein